MTSQEMMHTRIRPDQHFSNVAKLGEDPDWQIMDYPLESVDPNVEYLFGYEQKAFLAKQYK